MTVTLSGRTLEGPALVIAPHPDDETLGCGGMIAALTQHGHHVHTVFVTDGGASHTGSSLWSRQRLAECRESEASEALLRLGAADQPRTFLRLPDAGMPDFGNPSYVQALDALITILRGLKPRLVLLPWRRDPHRDHRDSWRLATDAIVRAGQTPKTLEYAIWLDEFGTPQDRPCNCEMERIAIDVSDHIEAKRHAVDAHRSQLGMMITDDPSGFVLTEQTITRLTGEEEVYWRPCSAR